MKKQYNINNYKGDSMESLRFVGYMAMSFVILICLMFMWNLGGFVANAKGQEVFDLKANHLRKNPDLVFNPTFEFSSPEIVSPPYIEGGGYKNERIAYANYISEGDKDFILTLSAENGSWAHDVKHRLGYQLCWTWDSWERGVLPNQAYCNAIEEDTEAYYSRFYRTHFDHGFCGLSDGYYKDVYEDPRFYGDWKWQMGECLRLYKGNTRFYGYDVRLKNRQNIIFPK